MPRVAAVSLLNFFLALNLLTVCASVSRDVDFERAESGRETGADDDEYYSGNVGPPPGAALAIS